MSWSAISLVLAAGVIHATWNLISKKARGGADFVMLFSALGCVIYAPVAVFLWWQVQPNLGFSAWAWIGLSGVLHFFYALALQRGYQVADLTVVYPIARGSGPLLATAGAILVLGEPATWSSLLGLALIVTGLITVSGVRLSRHVSGQRTFTGIAKGLESGLATGVCIALYTLVDASVVRRIALLPFLLDYGSNAVRTALLAPLMILRRKALLGSLRSSGNEVFAVAALMPLSYILILYAKRVAPVTRIAPVREISTMFAVLAGALVLGEPQGKWVCRGWIDLHGRHPNIRNMMHFAPAADPVWSKYSCGAAVVSE